VFTISSESTGMMGAEYILNSATFRKRWGLPEFLDACRARNVRKAGVWGDDIKQVGIDTACSMMREHEVQPFGYNRAGPFLASDASDRRKLLDMARSEIDDAVSVGADHILMFPGGLEPGSTDLAGARAQTLDAIGILREHAQEVGMTLALEPLHPMLCGDRTSITTLRHANEICARFAGKNIGVVIDTYHVWWDETLSSEIARTARENRILSFHVNDWLVPTTHLLTDRGMMGDGIIDLRGIWQDVQSSGYDGPVEVEIFSERWWNEDPDMAFDVALERCHKIFDE
jgi:sugar phosphate isomerase/epimerase